MPTRRNDPSRFSRRKFLVAGVTVAALPCTGRTADPPTHRQACGVKYRGSDGLFGHRLDTAHRERSPKRHRGEVRRQGAKEASPLTDVDVGKLHRACPGAAGRIRVRYGSMPGLEDAKITDWFEVTEKSNSAHSFALTGLPADSVVHFAVDTVDRNMAPHGSFAGSFRTAVKPGA